MVFEVEGIIWENVGINMYGVCVDVCYRGIGKSRKGNSDLVIIYCFLLEIVIKIVL